MPEIILQYSFLIIMSFALFLIMGRIGLLLSSFGYRSISSFNENEEAAGFNFVYRVSSPLVFIVVITYILYALSLYKYTYNIWVVVPISFLIKFFYIVIMNRIKLMNKLYFISSLIAFCLYEYFLIKGDFLFPDKNSISSQVWLLIILFIYNISNTISNNNKYKYKYKRERNYIILNYKEFVLQYSSVVTAYAKSKTLQRIILSVLIIENFNRPNFSRGLERLFGGKKTYGVMQVLNDVPLSDYESVQIGVKKLKEYFIESVREARIIKASGGYVNKHSVLNIAIRKYNHCDDYVNMVMQVYDVLKEYDVKNKKFK